VIEVARRTVSVHDGLVTSADPRPKTIFRENLQRLLELDDRSLSELARHAAEEFGRGEGAWRKGIARTIGTASRPGTWWPTAWVAEGLAWLFESELRRAAPDADPLATLYTPGGVPEPEPEM
jgi:hypothetical protein